MAGLLLSLAPAVAGSTADALLGKPPPPITVAKWIKGPELREFEPGKVYVIDFWATWCGPCKAAIPHLTELAQKHRGKVEVIGIAISERQKDATDTAYMGVVEQFVKKMDDRMDYRVAVDTPDRQMHTAWFKPAGMGGIPTAWIIDQKGLVAWIGIGSPTEVERIVGDVLLGRFEATREAVLQKAADEAAKQRSDEDIAEAKVKSAGLYANYPGYQEAMARGDLAAALESLNTAFQAHPASETTGAYQWKFMILLQRNRPEEVNHYVRKLLRLYPANDDIMSFASSCIVSTDDEPRFDPELALQTATIAAKLAKPHTRWAQFTRWRLGWAYFNTGNRDKAIQTMQSALDGLSELKETVDFGDLGTQCEEAMKRFRQPAK